MGKPTPQQHPVTGKPKVTEYPANLHQWATSTKADHYWWWVVFLMDLMEWECCEAGAPVTRVTVL